MKNHLIHLAILFCSTVGFTQTDGNEVKDSLFIQTHIGLMGRCNLLQLDFKINKRLFADIKHQVFFNQKKLQR